MCAGADAELQREARRSLVVGRLEDGHEVVVTEDGVEAEALHVGHLDLGLGAAEAVGVLEHQGAAIAIEGE